MSTTYELRIKEGDGSWQTLTSKSFTIKHTESRSGTGTSEALPIWGDGSLEAALVDWDAALISVDQLVHLGIRCEGSGLYGWKFLKIPKDCAILVAGKVTAADWDDFAGTTGRFPEVISLKEELGAEATMRLDFHVTTEADG